MVGTKGKWKTRFVKLCGGKLLIFSNKADHKARYCYSLVECNVTKSEGKLKLEHKDIETLYLKLTEKDYQSKLMKSIIGSAAKSILTSCLN